MKKILLIIVAILVASADVFACTSAIVTAQRSSEGVPMLWKHRDSKMRNTRVDYVTGGKYAYSALVPDNKNYNREVFGGINETGFGIISTTTYNLPISTPEEYAACERPNYKRNKAGFLQLALRECSTIEEFEQLLIKTKRKRKFDYNLGVADATGAVAYFEVWDLGYRRYDTMERAEGFAVRSNYAYSGSVENRGTSARRHDIVMQQMTNHQGTFTPYDFFDYSRSYNSCKYGDVLANDDVYLCDNYTVARMNSASTIVVVCDGKNPRMLITNGNPVSSVAVPIYVKAEHNIPQCVLGKAMIRLSEDFRAKAYKEVTWKTGYLNKELVRKVLKIKQPKIEMPKEMPADIVAFNAKIDKLYTKHEKRVRKILSKY